jgi:hypothetical protein
MASRIPWNKGKIIGQKAPLRQQEIWSIRARLEIANNLKELALFNLAIDSKLRGCDVSVESLGCDALWRYSDTHQCGTTKKRYAGDV